MTENPYQPPETEKSHLAKPPDVQRTIRRWTIAAWIVAGLVVVSLFAAIVIIGQAGAAWNQESREVMKGTLG